MIRLLAPIALACCLAACATVADPVPVGNGIYTLDAGAPGYGVGIGDESYQRAIKFCFDQGKQLLRADGNGAAGKRPQDSGPLRFRCIGPGETGWKEPVG